MKFPRLPPALEPRACRGATKRSRSLAAPAGEAGGLQLAGGPPDLYGGWGRLVVPTCTTESCAVGRRDVWNIATRTVKRYVMDPSFDCGFVWGVTHKYAYNGMAKIGAPYSTLVRFAVE